MTKAPTTSSAAGLDPQLARLIDDITAKLQTGEPVDLSAILNDHPEHAAELRDILPTLAALGDLSSSAQNGWNVLGQDSSAGVLGDFRLIRELGRGGMGIVYEAMQISLNRRVALKVLPFAATMDPKHLQRFRNEAMAAASLRHENIVHVYGVGCERSVHFYAMELIDGQTLAQIIAGLHQKPEHKDATSDYQPADAGAPTAPAGALSTEFSGIKGRELHRLAARLIADAADALEHAHSLGIVHRDIKPGNLMIDGAGKVYVTDFGLARFGPDAGLTMSGDLLGTLRYMSPEQAMARHGLVDHRTDVYSLGATLYELLTGRAAVVGEDKQEILKHIAFDESVALRKIDRAIPVELETITLKCLAKEPTERYASAGELAADLRRVLSDQPIRAKAPNWRERSSKWVRRHQALFRSSVAIGIVCVTAVGALAGLTWHKNLELTEAYSQALADRTAAQTNERQIRVLNESLRRTLYAAHMNLAHQAWESGPFERVTELLEQWVPQPGLTDLRGFEWHYLNRMCHSESLTLSAKRDRTVGGISFSPDGRLLASACLNGDVTVWNASTGHQVHSLRGHSKPALPIAFSPDSDRLASGSSDRTVFVWDLRTGQTIQTQVGDGDGPYYCLTFSPDGKRLAGVSINGKLKVWDCQTGNPLVENKVATGGALAFTPDGAHLTIVGAGKRVTVLDAVTGEPVSESDNNRVAAAIDPGSRLVASPNNWLSSDQSVKLWDAQSGRETVSLRGHTLAVESTAFSRDGARVATFSRDRTVRVWDTTTGQELVILKGHPRYARLAFAPDGRRLAVGSEDGVKVWDLFRPQEKSHFELHEGIVLSMAYSPDARHVASTSLESLKVWDSLDGKVIREIKGRDMRCVAFSADGRRVAGSVAPDGCIRVWDITSGKEVVGPLKVGSSVVRGLAFSTDGKRLVGATAGRVAVYDAETGQELLTLDRAGTFYSVAFSPDCQRLATTMLQPPVVVVWDANTGQEQLTLRGHTLNPTAVTFSKDGQRIASSAGDMTVRVWDAQTGEQLFICTGHNDSTTGVAFSPDGRRLATASRDRVKLWDTQTGHEVFSFAGCGCGLTFGPDGHRLASGTIDGKVMIWDGLPQSTPSFSNRRGP